MQQQDVLARVIAFFAELPRSRGRTITASTRLADEVLIDSLTMLQVILYLEAEFGLSLERSDLDYIDTPASVADLIHSRGSGS